MLQFLNVLAESFDHDPARLDKLIAETALGNESAFEELYRSIKASVYGYSLSVLKRPHDAEDVTHDCFVRIYANARSYVSHGKPLAWILTIAKRLCFDRLSEQKNLTSLDDCENDFSDLSLLSNDELTAVRSLISLLSDDERSIIMLHAVSGFRHREIAEFLSLPLSTVLSKYHRAIKKLKAAYIQDERNGK